MLVYAIYCNNGTEIFANIEMKGWIYSLAIQMNYGWVVNQFCVIYCCQQQQVVSYCDCYSAASPVVDDDDDG